MKFETSDTISQTTQAFAPIATRGKPKGNGHQPAFTPDQDIILWLGKNIPTSFDELIDIRYSLYHRCSCAEYRVKRMDNEELTIAGRQGSLHIVSNQARRLLLTKLRQLAKENGWRGALPRLRARRLS